MRKLYMTPYSYRGLTLRFEDQVRLAREMGYDGIEGGLGAGSLTDEECTVLDRYEMDLCIGMLPLNEDGSASEETLHRLRERGVEIVVPRMAGGPGFRMPPKDDFRGLPNAFGTKAQALEAAKRAAPMCEILARYGLKNYFHNHTHEFRVDGEKTVLEYYLDNTPENHVLEFDVGWALTAGIDPIAFMAKYPGRIGALHIKSCNWVIGTEALGMICPVPPLEKGISDDQKNANQTYAESPQGPMEKSICDWGAIIRAAEEVGCHTFIIERERNYCGDILRCLKEDHDFIRACMQD